MPNVNEAFIRKEYINVFSFIQHKDLMSHMETLHFLKMPQPVFVYSAFSVFFQLYL